MTIEGSRSWLLALGLVVLAGCYRPNIEDGAFLCGEGGACPAGFTCRANRCHNMGPGGNAMCVGPLLCSPAATAPPVCDPVCQSGCGCNEKCTNPKGTNTCAPAAGSSLEAYETCDAEGEDRCRPGSVCLPEVQERCQAHCYRFCRTDDDCPAMARCRAEAHDGQGNLLYKVCSPRVENCNPAGPNPRCGPVGNAQRPWPQFACYMLSIQTPEESVCECAGVLPEGATCNLEYSCVPGTECVPVGNDFKCRRLCTIDGVVLNPTACSLPQRCTPFPNSRRLGFCI